MKDADECMKEYKWIYDQVKLSNFVQTLLTKYEKYTCEHIVLIFITTNTIRANIWETMENKSKRHEKYNNLKLTN